MDKVRVKDQLKDLGIEEVYEVYAVDNHPDGVQLVSYSCSLLLAELDII